MKHFEQKYLTQEIKKILVEQTIDCDLPSDMNDLDMDSIMNEAVENLKKNKAYIRDVRMEKAFEFLYADDLEEQETMFDILDGLNCDSDNEMVDNIEGLHMVERFQDTFTVKELWEQITADE